jgi:L-amino acid N-acyltransferase YncA
VPPFTIRLARLTDLPDINAIYNHYVLDSTASYQNEPETLEDRGRWFHAHSVAHPVLVAEIDGRVIGWGSLSRYHPRAAYAHTVEDSIYIHYGHHHKGVGRALLGRLQDLGREAQHHSIVALISADQLPSIALHRSCGFIEVGRLREVGNKFSRWLDVVFMQCMLTGASAPPDMLAEDGGGLPRN